MIMMGKSIRQIWVNPNISTIDNNQPGTDIIHSNIIGDQTCIPALIFLRHIVQRGSSIVFDQPDCCKYCQTMWLKYSTSTVSTSTCRSCSSKRTPKDRNTYPLTLMIQKLFAFHTTNILRLIPFQLPCEKTNNLHLRKQRRRSAGRRSAI